MDQQETTTSSLKSYLAAGVSWPNWSGQTVAILGCGPSLRSEQIERVAGIPVIAINDTGRSERLPVAAPWADVLYAADVEWWRHYRPVFRGLRVAAGEQARAAIHEGLVDVELKMTYGERVCAVGEALNCGHSGFHAPQIAIACGARRVILLGYDCKPNGDRTNYFGTKDRELYKDSPYATWLRDYPQLLEVAGGRTEIINCTPGSAIDCFERRALEEVL